MRIARSEFFDFAIHIEGTHLDVHDLGFGGANHPLDGEPFAEGDDVGLGSREC
jgi:hypothetical protein